MTSNMGSSQIASGSKIGFSSDTDQDGKSESDYLRMRERVMETVKDPRNGFKPEFLNRIDAVVVFHALG